MSDLIAVSYPDRQTAETVRQRLAQLTREHAIELEDAVVVTREADGKVKLHQAVNLPAAGAATGALWGGLIGLLFLAPLFGMAIGAAAGGASGAFADVGVNDKFMKDLGQRLQPARRGADRLGAQSDAGQSAAADQRVRRRRPADVARRRGGGAAARGSRVGRAGGDRNPER